MKHITTWRPDTCDCIIQYEWDDAVPDTERVHELKTMEKCEAHKQNGNSLAYTVVTDENKRKNMAYTQIIENMPDLVDETIERGQTIKRFKETVEFKFSFDKNRRLKIELAGATEEQKTRARNVLHSAFPNNKPDLI